MPADDHHERHSLLRACFRSYLLSFLSPIIPRICLTSFTFAQPFLISTTINFVSKTNPDSTYGKGLIGAWALVYLGIAVSKQLHSIELSKFNQQVNRSQVLYTGIKLLGLPLGYEEA